MEKKKSSNYQLGRAHELVFKNAVTYNSTSETYKVNSSTQKGKSYLVIKKGKNLECECLGWSFNGQCSHTVAVRVFQRSKLK